PIADRTTTLTGAGSGERYLLSGRREPLPAPRSSHTPPMRRSPAAPAPIARTRLPAPVPSRIARWVRRTWWPAPPRSERGGETWPVKITETILRRAGCYSGCPPPNCALHALPTPVAGRYAARYPRPDGRGHARCSTTVALRTAGTLGHTLSRASDRPRCDRRSKPAEPALRPSRCGAGPHGRRHDAAGRRGAKSGPRHSRRPGTAARRGQAVGARGWRRGRNRRESSPARPPAGGRTGARDGTRRPRHPGAARSRRRRHPPLLRHATHVRSGLPREEGPRPRGPDRGGVC